MSKTKIMHFRKASVERTNHHFIFGDKAVAYGENYRYLGMEFNETLDYSHSVDILSGASGRALGALISRYYATNGLHYNTYSKLYSNLVEPVMDYVAAIWGYKAYNVNNTVQHRAMRCFLGVGKYTAIPALYGELGWKTPQMRHHLDMVRYFVRLVNMDKSRLTYKVFRWDYDRPRSGTWCHEIKSILSRCDLLEYYETLSVQRHVNITAKAGQKLVIEQKTLWDVSRIMPKLINYNKIKLAFAKPTYVLQRLTRQERSALARFYCGNLPLKVETGRYRSIPREQRLCTRCNVVEDEMHFLVECEQHTESRAVLLHNINTNGLTIDDNFKQMCANISPKSLATFIINALIVRRN